MTRSTIRFRHGAPVTMAAVIALIGSVPLAAVGWYLAPVALVPATVCWWSLRTGTDVDDDGLVVRAMLGRRRIPWSRVAELTAAGRRAYARLTDGGRIALPAVSPADLGRLVDRG